MRSVPRGSKLLNPVSFNPTHNIVYNVVAKAYNSAFALAK
jgi:hypothetical protein